MTYFLIRNRGLCIRDGMFTARYELNVKLDFSLNWVSKRISYKFPCRTEEAVLLQGEHKVFP